MKDSLTSQTCFLIDDDLDDQEIFCLALNDIDLPIDCVCANDGAYAIQKLMGDATFIPNIIFIDMNMPRVNGMQCLEEIKKIERLKHVPIFIYSTSADPKTVLETKLLGAVDFIIKPPSINALVNILNGIFKQNKKKIVDDRK